MIKSIKLENPKYYPIAHLPYLIHMLWVNLLLAKTLILVTAARYPRDQWQPIKGNGLIRQMQTPVRKEILWQEHMGREVVGSYSGAIRGFISAISP